MLQVSGVSVLEKFGSLIEDFTKEFVGKYPYRVYPVPMPIQRERRTILEKLCNVSLLRKGIRIDLLSQDFDLVQTLDFALGAHHV
jgi:hypothetical protein